MSRSKEWWPCLYRWLLSLEATNAIRFNVKTYEWRSTLLSRGLNRPFVYSSYSFHGNLNPILSGCHIHRLKKKYICEAVTKPVIITSQERRIRGSHTCMFEVLTDHFYLYPAPVGILYLIAFLSLTVSYTDIWKCIYVRPSPSTVSSHYQGRTCERP